jgi:branched-chain amino acid transport system ATP-binding protein
VLAVRDLQSGYEDIQVLQGISLEVREGELVALFGPNGHGKSTLLKAISGVHQATSGAVLYQGRDITRLPAHRIVREGIAYIAEERYLFPEMTVRENLRMGAYNRQARNEMGRNLELVYEVFPALKDRERQLCITLSGGEGRMVAIARGLMSGASLLLVDEPSIGLAPSLKNSLYAAIRRINTEGGVTILLVEQEIEHALEMAVRFYVLKKGQILLERPAAEAEPGEIKEAYF